MTQGVNQGFSQCADRHFKTLLPHKASVCDLPAEIKMLEKERHAGIKEVEEVSLGTLIVDEFKFVVAEEPSQS